MIVKLIEKIEGEAILSYELDSQKRVKNPKVSFATSRYIEDILKGKDVWDALVINPRVCGICGHSHLIATAKAIEDAFGIDTIPKNAKILREITLLLEIIQNHIKWFYLTIYPLVGFGFETKKATTISRLVTKMIATIAGQYPHTSYAVVGGVTSVVTPIEKIKLKRLSEELIELFQNSLILIEIDEFLRCNKIEKMLKKDGDLPKVMQKFIDNSWEHLGKSYDRFIVFGEGRAFRSGKSISTKYTQTLNSKFVQEFDIKDSKAKLVKYKNRFYEVGPLARAMINKTSLIKESHRRFGDSIFSRVLARVCEVPQLLSAIVSLIEEIDPSKEFFQSSSKTPSKASGVGIVEASRGSLIHKIDIENGKISNYKIITPTQWNLGSSKNGDAIIQKALIGLREDEPIELIFKSFDICSVCTTH
jgi:hydrogenase large subunit